MKFPIKTIKRNNQIVALPKNTSEVSKLVKFAKKIKYHILPIGGETNRGSMEQNHNLRKQF